MLVVVCLSAFAADRSVADLEIPGSKKFVKIARDVLDVRLTLNPDAAANAGLYGDIDRVPSYTPAAVAALDRRLQKDLDGLARLPWDRLTVDEQIDVRWTYALAEEAHHRLIVERSWTHRAGEWLEPVSNVWIALVGQVPDRVDLQQQVAAQIPAVIDEVRREVTAPTARDVETTIGLVDGLLILTDMLPAGAERDAARTSLEGYRADLSADGLPEFRVIGADSYAWRLERAMLSPWTPEELLEVATRELATVDARLAELGATDGLAPPTDPTPEELALAEGFDREDLLGLYDRVVEENLAELRRIDVLTLPADLPVLRARETPDAMVPLTGDGGSMNPVTLFGPPTPGWWNVEHFQSSWTLEERLQKVVAARRHIQTSMGPYAVHEGVPGHHLQFVISRANQNPVRTLFADNASVEGWGLYAEEMFWDNGAYGRTELYEAAMLRSYRFRIRRVFYDVNVTRGTWTLQQAADWRAGTEAGTTSPNPEILRSIQWPTQLIGYFHGKAQIEDLLREAAAKEGFSIRDFHDDLLAAGLIPVALVRAKLLDLPVPPLPSRR